MAAKKQVVEIKPRKPNAQRKAKATLEARSELLFEAITEMFS